MLKEISFIYYVVFFSFNLLILYLYQWNRFKERNKVILGIEVIKDCHSNDYRENKDYFLHF